MKTKSTDEADGMPHESVLVGALCMAAGAISMKLQMQANRPHTRATLFNLSHNPLDPAAGDAIYKVFNDDSARYFLLELKVDLFKGIASEMEKHDRRNFHYPNSYYLLKQAFPKCDDSHFLGWLGDLQAAHGVKKILQFSPYWLALGKDFDQRWAAAQLLFTCAENQEVGMTREMLVDYVTTINFNAEEGSGAQRGALKFAVALNRYELYMSEESQFLSLSHDYDAELKLKAQQQSPSRPASTTTRDGP